LELDADELSLADQRILTGNQTALSTLTGDVRASVEKQFMHKKAGRKLRKISKPHWKSKTRNLIP
jgi:hypothetical protein